MAVTLNLQKYHHLVIITKDPWLAVQRWADIFKFEAPVVNDVGPGSREFFDEYPSLFRGKPWHSDFKQSVFRQPSFFFEINGIGDTADCFTEFEDTHGNGICYFGFAAEEKRDSFISRVNYEYEVPTIVEQYFPGGDWSVIGTEKLLGCNLCVKKEVSGSHSFDPMMPDFTEASILVPDLINAVKYWEELFDVKDIALTDKYVEARFRDSAVKIRIKAAELEGGPFPLHLIQSGLREEQGPFTEYYKRHGNGIWNISMPEPPEGIDTFSDRMRDDFGYSIYAEYPLFGKVYTVFDTVDELGTNITIAR